MPTTLRRSTDTPAFAEAKRRAQGHVDAGRAKTMPEALDLVWCETPALYIEHGAQRRSGTFVTAEAPRPQTAPSRPAAAMFPRPAQPATVTSSTRSVPVAQTVPAQASDLPPGWRIDFEEDYSALEFGRAGGQSGRPEPWWLRRPNGFAVGSFETRPEAVAFAWAEHSQPKDAA